jgi:hypothetical protein
MELDSIEGNLIMDKGTVSTAQTGGTIRVSGATECKDDCLFESSLSTRARACVIFPIWIDY